MVRMLTKSCNSIRQGSSGVAANYVQINLSRESSRTAQVVVMARRRCEAVWQMESSSVRACALEPPSKA